MKDPYSVLGVSPSATDDEIKAAYRALVRKYHPDNYADDNPLKDLANEKMAEINAAYEEIHVMRTRAQSGAAGDTSGASGASDSGTGSARADIPEIYKDIRVAINSRRFHEAEKLLSSVPEGERIAEWHFLHSLTLVRRGRYNESMRELETACTMDPGNEEYQKAKEMYNQNSRGYGSTYYGGESRRGMDSNDVCNCCANLICLDCLCECMGGDLIPCI